MKNKNLFFAYATIVALYAMIFWLAIGAGKTGQLVTDETEYTHPVVMGSDSLQIEWHLILPDEPVLTADRKAGDTLRTNINRYQTGMVSNISQNKDLPAELLIRTDRFSDFRLRFNGDSAALAQFHGKMDFTSLGQMSEREGHILSLVNSTDVLLDRTLRGFSADVIEKDLYIDIFPDANFLAVATIAYKDTLGTVFPVRLTLEQNCVDDAPVWYVIHAESPYFTFGDDDNPYYIDFIENELRFMGLGDNANRSAESIAGPAFKGDGLSAYLALTSKGFIKYQYADQVQYVVKTGDYTLLVEHVENFEHKRSGYLITRIIKDGQIIFANQPY